MQKNIGKYNSELGLRRKITYKIMELLWGVLFMGIVCTFTSGRLKSMFHLLFSKHTFSENNLREGICVNICSSILSIFELGTRRSN